MDSEQSYEFYNSLCNVEVTVDSNEDYFYDINYESDTDQHLGSLQTFNLLDIYNWNIHHAYEFILDHIEKTNLLQLLPKSLLAKFYISQSDLIDSLQEEIDDYGTCLDEMYSFLLETKKEEIFSSITQVVLDKKINVNDFVSPQEWYFDFLREAKEYLDFLKKEIQKLSLLKLEEDENFSKHNQVELDFLKEEAHLFQEVLSKYSLSNSKQLEEKFLQKLKRNQGIRNFIDTDVLDYMEGYYSDELANSIYITLSNQLYQNKDQKIDYMLLLDAYPEILQAELSSAYFEELETLNFEENSLLDKYISMLVKYGLFQNQSIDRDLAIQLLEKYCKENKLKNQNEDYNYTDLQDFSMEEDDKKIGYTFQDILKSDGGWTLDEFFEAIPQKDKDDIYESYDTDSTCFIDDFVEDYVDLMLEKCIGDDFHPLDRETVEKFLIEKIEQHLAEYNPYEEQISYDNYDDSDEEHFSSRKFR